MISWTLRWAVGDVTGKWLIAIVATLLLIERLRAEEAPLVGRPSEVPFTGAVARFAVVPGPLYQAPFQVEASISPTTAEALQPLIFALTVRAIGPVLHPPERLDLRQLPLFQRVFFIEDLTDELRESLLANHWRWRYRLRPRGTWVREVPGVPFLYYNPDIRPARLGYQTLYSDAIPLTVRPAELAGAPTEVPAQVLELASDAAILQASGWSGPSAWLVGLSLAVPPIGCLLWYLLWRRLYPDAASLRSRRRSRAARRALAELASAQRLVGRQRAERLTNLLNAYLAERFEPPGAEPTPEEIRSLLQRHDVPQERIAEGVDLIACCAEGRFQPSDETPSQLAQRLRSWIQAMEERT